MPPILFFVRHTANFAELICLEVLARTGFYRWFEFGFDPGRYRFGGNLDRQKDLKDEVFRSRAHLPLIS